MISKICLNSLWLLAFAATLPATDEIPIAAIQKTEPVDFNRDILPFLQQNCLACHSSTESEGDVILETPATIIQSKSVVPGKPEESLILTVSAHQVDPAMPPEDNEVNAQNLTSEQLGLLQLWIKQGAKSGSSSMTSKVEFARLPKGVNPVYAMSMSPDGQFLAAGRANQIFVYRVPSKQLISRTTDPELLKSSLYQQPGIAHLDLVQSLAFAPNNLAFISGGFRTVKVWKPKPPQVDTLPTGIAETPTSQSHSAGRRFWALGGSKGSVQVFDLETRKAFRVFKTGDQPVSLISIDSQSNQAICVTKAKHLRLFNCEKGNQVGREIELAGAVVSATFLDENRKIAIGLSDKSIEIYNLDNFNQPPDAAIAPVKKLTGHQQPATHLIAFGEKHSQILSGSNDGTARTWNLDSGQPIKTYTFTGQICGLDVSEATNRVITCALNGSVKLFDLNSGAVFKEIKGTVDVEYQTANHDRLVRLKQQLVDVAKKDLDAGNKEKTDEDANVKKTEEALKKATADVKTKLEAKTKSETAFSTVDKAVKTHRSTIATLETQTKENAAKIKPLMEMQQALVLKLKTTDAKLKQLALQKTNQEKQYDTAKKQFETDPANETFKKSMETISKTKLATTAELEALQKAKSENAAQTAAFAAKLKSLNTQKGEIAKKLAAAQAALKKEEPNLKKTTDAQKKATDEHNASVRNETLAKNSVARAKDRAKKSAEKVPVLQASHKQATDTKAAQEKIAKAYKDGNNQTLMALSGIAVTGSGRLFYHDKNGNIASCDLATGEKLGSLQLPKSSKFSIAIGYKDQLITSSEDSKLLSFHSFDDEWVLARTIGNIDDEQTLTDRVTALDVSSDGKWIATGSGVPSRSGHIKIWNFEDGKLVREIKDAHSDTILDLKFSPDGTKVASGSSDRFMKTFDLETGKLIRIFEGHTHHVMSVDWNSTGRELSSAGADKVVKVWDASTGTQKRTISG
ncbi:MAG: c-type cytochrome domain-containing protein, partial [Planctomycetota bacterium]|nr:c-type cytochrome domain-containing protein [Planctomycetota bacterium]